MKNKKTCFVIISGLIVICFIIPLNCSAIIKILSILGMIILGIIAVFRRWEKEKWILASFICLFLLNMYFQCTVYLPYRYHTSAAYNSLSGFSTTQVCYVYNNVNSDALLCSILKNRDILIYGNENSKIYQRYLKFYANNVTAQDHNKNVDFLKERQEEFIDIGKMTISHAWDCFDDKNIKIMEQILEMDDSTRPHLYFKSDKIIEKDELIIAIDSLHNIYVMSNEEWESIING